ncbi:DUF4185 domain-containing protein [Paenibacillaceae bacterium WGS1546]|uniref:DUF4185 domain-containing protein n=1 Tax=Cohnella sp. WGS1546 TaxID=3366810 RepID=UPI00372D1845
MKRTIGITALAAMATLAACKGGDDRNPMLDAGGKAFVLTGVTDLVQVAQLTGADSPNKTDRYGVYGTDLGSMINAGDRTYFVFGDTFGERPSDMIGGGGSFWRSNTLAYATDADPADGIAFDGMIADDLGLAKELLPSAKVDYEEMTKIPTHGLYANGALYLYYMSVNHWGAPGHWDANYASVAKSTDEGENWTLLDDLRWPGDSNFIQVSPYKVETGEGESDFYFWSIPAGRFGGVQLMKVGEASVEHPAEYRYFAGLDEKNEPIWSEEMSRAETVVDDAVGELSVVWNPYLERWLMTYLNEGNGVVIREGLAPWGPWGDKLELVRADEYPGLYAPYMNDKYTSEDGRVIYFALSLWDPYNVFWFKAALNK